MIRQSLISSSISRAAVSLLMAWMAVMGCQSQGFLKWQADSIPLFRGVAVSFDLAGAVQRQLSSYGQYEAALRVNLHDQYFPTLELGIGEASHDHDEVTGISYHTRAPYVRLGVDFNLLKKKHTGNRVFGGFRYAFTSYKVDIDHRPFPDPTWKWETSYGVKDVSCYQHWLEAVFGIDSKVFGPLHLGWSVRYRRRLFHDDGIMGKTWYVPGYGIQESSRLGYTFNITIDI